jgi:P-type conjugative transfer protein TrbG
MKGSVYSLLLIGLALGVTWGRQASSPPVPVAPPAMSQQQALDRAAAYNAALKMLGAAGGVVSTSQNSPSPKSASRSKVNKNDDALALQRVDPLPANVRAALTMTDSALNTDPRPRSAADGRVIYTFGEGIPPIVCALLQVTEIDLEPGERATERDVDVGDDEFKISVHKGADRGGAFDYLIIKPTVADVETTLTVATDRRVYYFRLIATQREHIARISFSYPEEEKRRKRLEEEAEQVKAAEVTRLAALAPAKEIKNWKYTVDVHGRDAHYMLPLSVGDDGSRTYIQLSQEVRKIGLPALSLTGAMGPIPANSHWEENELVVDALFERGCLLEGVGKQQQRVCIHKETPKGGGSHADGN